MSAINPPPIRVPKKFSEDPELFGYFNALHTYLRQLWERAAPDNGIDKSEGAVLAASWLSDRARISAIAEELQSVLRLIAVQSAIAAKISAKADDLDVVKLTGDQSIAGVKTFEEEIFALGAIVDGATSGRAAIQQMLGFPVVAMFNGTADTDPAIAFFDKALAALDGLPDSALVSGAGGSSSVDTALSRTGAGEWTAYYNDGSGFDTSPLGNIVTKVLRRYAGSPEGNVSAPVGAICNDTANGDVYAKDSGTGSTGWVRLKKEPTPKTVSVTEEVISTSTATWEDISSSALTIAAGSFPDGTVIRWHVQGEVECAADTDDIRFGFSDGSTTFGETLQAPFGSAVPRLFSGVFQAIFDDGKIHTSISVQNAHNTFNTQAGNEVETNGIVASGGTIRLQLWREFNTATASIHSVVIERL